MQLLKDIVLVILGYVLGSIPFGLIIVKLRTGKDLRSVESGRTGGTNALRAAGLAAGLATAVMDIMKGAAAVWIARAVGSSEWVHWAAPVGAILGHNYSMFMPERDEQGRLVRLRGGAGGAPTVGGALGLWAPSFLIVIPVGALAFFLLGYASVTTMSVALAAAIIFAVRAYMGYSPWSYALYGVVAEMLLMWALRPNIKKLIAGTERVVGISLHGRMKAKHKHEPESADEAVRDME
jgi:acyl phosphate:glycerol-3-phosphate acyltransferase